MRNIFCIGAATIDHKLKTSDGLLSGTSNPVTSFTTHGGVARNVAENLSYWTKHIHLQCIVGDDEYGREIIKKMQANGVNTEDCMLMPKQTTAHYYAVLTKKGELHIAMSDMELYEQIDKHTFINAWDKWQRGDIVFIDTNLPTNILIDAITIADRKQVLLCFDPVSVAKSAKLPFALNGTFLLKPNKQEASALTNINLHTIKDYIDAGKKLLRRGVENIVMSLGQEGYLIINPEDTQHVTIQSCTNVIDENGAGDAFMAGILYGLQKEKKLLQACEWGEAAARLTLQSDNTVTKSSIAELEQMISNHNRIHTYANIL